MSRLYLRGSSDTRKTPITSRGHEEISVELLYGSKEDSRTAVDVTVKYIPHTDTFILIVDKPRTDYNEAQYKIFTLAAGDDIG